MDQQKHENQETSPSGHLGGTKLHACHWMEWNGGSSRMIDCSELPLVCICASSPIHPLGLTLDLPLEMGHVVNSPSGDAFSIMTAFKLEKGEGSKGKRLHVIIAYTSTGLRRTRNPPSPGSSWPLHACWRKATSWGGLSLPSQWLHVAYSLKLQSSDTALRASFMGSWLFSQLNFLSFQPQTLFTVLPSGPPLSIMPAMTLRTTPLVNVFFSL